MIRNAFTGKTFASSSSSKEVLLPIGSGSPKVDYRAKFGWIVGEKGGNKGNQAVADIRRNMKWANAE